MDTQARFESAASAAFPLQRIALSTGVDLPYIEHGDAGGFPVVLLHGLTDSLRSFESMLPHLPSWVRAFALSQRGHGDADRPAEGYRTRDFAADVAAFIDALGLARPLVVGHSLGSTNAMRLAIDFPRRLRGLYLIGAFASYGGNPAIVDFWNDAVAGLTDPVDPQLAREFQQGTLFRPVAPGLVDQAVEESLKVPAHVWRQSLAGCLEDDFAGELHRIASPTMLVWGSRDNFVPRADQDVLLARIAGSRLRVIEGGGHAPHWEDPRGFAADIAAFAAALRG